MDACGRSIIINLNGLIFRRIADHSGQHFVSIFRVRASDGAVRSHLLSVLFGPIGRFPADTLVDAPLHLIEKSRRARSRLVHIKTMPTSRMTQGVLEQDGAKDVRSVMTSDMIRCSPLAISVALD